MSEKITTLQDNNFIADVNFISVNKATGQSSYLPIDLASVTYFEINDNLIDFGLTGNITFPNWGQLLSKLKGFGFQGSGNAGVGVEKLPASQASSNLERYLTISIKDTNIPIEEQGYEFLANAKSSSSLSLNAVDVKQTLEFEENLTAVLKQTSWDVFSANTDIEKSFTGSALNLVGPQFTVGGALLQVLALATDGAALLSPEAKRLNQREAEFSSFSESEENANNGQLRGRVRGEYTLPLFFYTNMIDLAFDDNDTTGQSSKSLYGIAQDLYNHTVYGGPEPTPMSIDSSDAALEQSFEEAFRGGASLPLLKTKSKPAELQADKTETAEEEEEEISNLDKFKGLGKAIATLGKDENGKEEEEEEEVDVSDGEEEEEMLGAHTPPRVLEIGELISLRHLEFVAEYKKVKPSSDGSQKEEGSDVAAVLKKKENDFSDVYMEDFSIAPNDVPNVNASIHNNVEEYDLIQPDINNLRQTVWGNYELSRTSIDKQVIAIINFNDLADEFERDFLGGNKSNLPAIYPHEAKQFKLHGYPETDEGIFNGSVRFGLMEARIRNLVFKSFIYLNETIVLNVKGKMYRKPGKFITIKGELADSPAQELWFVIEVKHKFENGDYRNEIKAVRFLSDGDYISGSRTYVHPKLKAWREEQALKKEAEKEEAETDARARGMAASLNNGDATAYQIASDADGEIISQGWVSDPLGIKPGGTPLSQAQIQSRSRADAEKKLAAEEEKKKNGFGAPPPRSNTVRVVVPAREEE
jgi:hypothetical protein